MLHVLKARTVRTALARALRAEQATAPRVPAQRELLQRRARCVPRATAARALRVRADVLRVLKARMGPSLWATATRALRAEQATAPRVPAQLELLQRRARCVPRATAARALRVRADVLRVLKARTVLSALARALRVARATAPRAAPLRERARRRAQCALRATLG